MNSCNLELDATYRPSIANETETTLSSIALIEFYPVITWFPFSANDNKPPGASFTKLVETP